MDLTLLSLSVKDHINTLKKKKKKKGSKERYLLGQDKTSQFFLGNLLRQATKRHLNNSQNDEKR